MNRRSDLYLPGILNGVAGNYALIMTLLVAGVSWLPAPGVPVWSTLLVVLTVMGVALVVLGVLDHRLLTRTMALAPEVSDGQPL